MTTPPNPFPAPTGFLDCVIALEGALLSGSKTELTYKFKLYGALFLRDERDPETTFAELGLIYKVRYGLVQGSPVQPLERGDATRFARDLARAVVLKAVTDGWPDHAVLDQVALGEGPVS